MCDTNKNVTKIDMIVKGVYYIQTTIKWVYSFWMLNDMRLCVQTLPLPLMQQPLETCYDSVVVQL